MDMVRKRTSAVRKAIGSSLMRNHIEQQQDDYLNINKYKGVETMMQPGLHRHALIREIQEKYLNPVMQSLETS